MMPRRLDVKMERRHVGVEAHVQEIVGVRARLRTMRGRAVEEAGHGAQRLQEGRHAEVVEGCGHGKVLPSAILTEALKCTVNPAVQPKQ